MLNSLLVEKQIRLNVDGIVKTAGLQDATFMSLL